MAIRTCLGRGLVKQCRLALYVPLLGVALGAGDIRMASGQWKLRALVMVKRRGSPALIDVAVRAFCHSVLGGKLRAVRIGVAALAIFRRPSKLNFVRTGERFVAFVARNRAMRAHERKFCFGMVKATDVDPRTRVVARFATEGGAVRALLLHAVLEFAFVGIGMAGRTGAVRKMEWQDLVGSSAEACLVAIGTGDGHVRAGQYKTSVLVLCDREGRAMKILYGVAVLAAILIRRGGELLVMRVLVAVQAGCEFYFV